jgi:prepilin-type N-terminal cleavage/methylation domain-containing protein
MSPLRPASRTRGYSLIELMIVVAIIAVMALASAPWFFKIMQRNTMKSAAQEMSITFAAARMRAVKRNLPAEVRITIASGSQSFHLLETFDMVQPIALKVAEARITSNVVYPPAAALLPFPNPSPLQVRFLPDGRIAQPLWFTIRGPVGAGVQNDLTVSINPAGKINVLGPNITLAKPLGTEWK